MKKTFFRLLSYALTVIMLMISFNCLFGITVYADTVERDSGNMPKWIFDPEKWDDITENIYLLADGSTRFTNTYTYDFGTDLSNSEFTVDMKSNGDWSLALRTDANCTSGYIIGCTGDSLYIKKIGSSIMLARCANNKLANFNKMEWHRYTVKFEDYEGYTVLSMKVDGVQVPFIDGFSFSPSKGFEALDIYDTDVAVIGGALWDYAPIQTGNTYMRIKPSIDGGNNINPMTAIYLRSIDQSLEGKKDVYRIAMIGDSITHANALEDGVWKVTYGKCLNELLGNTYDVYNGGVSGAHALARNTGFPYKVQCQYTFTSNFDADLFLIMLGTNDANYIKDSTTGELLTGDALEEWHQKFKADYKALIQHYVDTGKPVVISAAPYNTNTSWPEGAVKTTSDWGKEVAAEMGLPCVDMWAFVNGHDDWLKDGCHPNALGYENMSKHMYEFLTNSEDIDLTKTDYTDLATPDRSDYIYEETLTSFDGSFNTSTFNSYGESKTSSATDLRYINGDVSANQGAVSFANYNLGEKWSVDFSYQSTTSGSATILSGEYSWDNYRYSSFKVGPLDFRVYHFRDKDGNYYYGYRLFMVNTELCEPSITDSFTAAASYNIDYTAGTIKITRTNDNVVLFDVDYAPMYKVVGANYSFDNVKLAICSYEYNAYTYWTSLKVESKNTAVNEYDITNTDLGHIELADELFDNTAKHYVGEKLVLNAVCDEYGCAFIKWVDGNGNKVSSNPQYVVNFTGEKVTLKAIFSSYVSYAEMNVTASEGGSVTINGAPYDITADYLVGADALLNAIPNSGYKFVCWKDASGNVVSADAEWNMILPKYADYVAVFAPISATADVTVMFCNRVGQIVATITVAAGNSVTLPSLPSSYGYDCTGWMIDGQIKAAGETVSIDSDTVVFAAFKKTAAKYTVSVSCGTVNGLTSGQYDYNTKVTVVFDSLVLDEGEIFCGWHIVGAKNESDIINYNQSYSFYVGANVELTAIVGNSEAVSVPVISVTDVSLVNGGKYATFLTERALPADYTLVASGVIYTADVTNANALTLDNTAATVHSRKGIYTSANGQFRMTLSSRDGSSITVYLAAYLTYIDDLGNVNTIYSDVYNATTVSTSGSQDIIEDLEDNF